MKLFSPNQKVYTKVKNEEPTYYSKTSHIKIVSILFRVVLWRNRWTFHCFTSGTPYEGSEVRGSLLFPGVVIHENAIVEHAILDKGVEVAAGVTIRGTEEAPVVVKKRNDYLPEDIV